MFILFLIKFSIENIKYLKEPSPQIWFSKDFDIFMIILPWLCLPIMIFLDLILLPLEIFVLGLTTIIYLVKKKPLKQMINWEE